MPRSYSRRHIPFPPSDTLFFANLGSVAPMRPIPPAKTPLTAAPGRGELPAAPLSAGESEICPAIPTASLQLAGLV